MAYYIQHLYGGKLPTHLMSGAPISESDNHPYILLAELYIFGELMGDPKFQNAVIREFFRLAHLDKPKTIKPTKLPCHSHINIIYKGTSSESPARRLMVDIATACRLHDTRKTFVKWMLFLFFPHFSVPCLATSTHH